MSGYGYAQNEDMGSDEEGGDESMSSNDSSDSNSEVEMNWSDLFEADDTNIGNPLAPKNKQDILLDRERGITDTNWGLNSLMYGMLTPVTVCIERLQTTKQPIQHRLKRELSKMIREIRRNYISEDGNQPEYDPVFQEWRKTMMLPLICKEGLVKYLERVSKDVATELVKGLENRLSPYTSFYSAMELIDPTAPGGQVSIETWEAVEVLCKKYDLDYTNVRREILEMRDNSVDLSIADGALCKSNLLSFYRNNYNNLPVGQSRYCLEAYAKVIFQLPFETVLIESIFSIMNYNKDKKRSRLKDSTMADIIHTKDLPVIVDKKLEGFDNNIQLDIENSYNHRLKW